MNKVRGTSSFPSHLGEQEFNVKKQGFVSLQEKKVFNTWKKFWLVFKHMDFGTSPRVILDAYINESQFRSGSSPKHTFNLTGTVAPVVVCQQSHKQVKHMFVVCPPGSRYIFECDSHFGMESWVMELNESLFPRTNGVDHILTELSASFKLNGSLRHRTKSNSMNDISKIGSEPPEIPMAPPLPPPNKRPVIACTSFPVSPAINRNNSSGSKSSEELVSRYRVEVEVSTLSQIPKGICIVLVQRESIRMCHAVTMDSMAIWHITHIREFKLTNDDKLIITSGNRSVTGYGQVRLSGVDCRALYYKVKVFVRSKSKNTRTAVTLPDRKGIPPILPARGTTLCVDSCANGLTDMTSPPESPSSINKGPGENQAKNSRPLPDIPPETVYSKIGASPPPSPSHTDNYSTLCHPDSKYNWPLNETNPFANIDQCQPTETEYSQLSAGNRCCPHIDDTYNVTHHPNNQVGKWNPCHISPQRRDQNILDSLKHINLIEQSRNVRKSEAYIDFSASYSSDSSTNPYEESLSEIRKSLSLIGSEETKRYPKRNVVSCGEVTGDSDSDPEIPLTDNVAYGTIKPPPSDNIPVSPYIITKPLLPPKLKKH